MGSYVYNPLEKIIFYFHFIPHGVLPRLLLQFKNMIVADRLL
jgi:hypothetical protein